MPGKLRCKLEWKQFQRIYKRNIPWLFGPRIRPVNPAYEKLYQAYEKVTAVFAEPKGLGW